MKKSELFGKAIELVNSSLLVLETHNQSWYEVNINGKCFDVLKSYSTVVAVFSRATATCYVRDFYSNTTSKQVSKFINKFNAVKVVYLYKRSDRTVIANEFGQVFKAAPSAISELINKDWEDVIEDI